MQRMDDSQAVAAAAAVPGMRKRVRELDKRENCTEQDHPDECVNMKAFQTLDMIRAATQHLATADPRLAGLITEFGPPERLLAKQDSCFRSLAKSILYQQLAGTAAAAIFSRFLAVCGVPDETQLTPSAVLSASPADLRACGLSERKASYLLDLAAHFQDGRLSDDLLTSLSDAALLSTLTAVRGIGPWTVDMFSMFHLGRPDILPVGDLGVRKGLAHLCGLSHLPSPAEMEQLTASWRPFRSLGCYYMWRIPLPPNRTAAATGKGSSSKAKSKSSRGGRKGQVVRMTNSAAAAAAAVADVGINLSAALPAAACVDGVHVVTGTVQHSSNQIEVAPVADAGCIIDDDGVLKSEQQQHELLDEATPAKQQQQQMETSPASAPEVAVVAAANGMMTRRRLKWSIESSDEQRQQSPTAAAATAVPVPPACDGAPGTLRVVDLG